MLELEQTGQPIILLSTSGTRLIAEAVRHGITYACCLRNAAAQARYLLAQDRDVLILGADSRGEFREEDQLCAARIARDSPRAGSASRMTPPTMSSALCRRPRRRGLGRTQRAIST